MSELTQNDLKNQAVIMPKKQHRLSLKVGGLVVTGISILVMVTIATAVLIHRSDSKNVVSTNNSNGTPEPTQNKTATTPATPQSDQSSFIPAPDAVPAKQPAGVGPSIVPDPGFLGMGP